MSLNFNIVCCFAKNPCDKCKPFIYDESGSKIRWNKEDEGWEDVCRDCNEPWSKDGEYVCRHWYCKKCCSKPAECDRCGAGDKQTEMTYHGEILCQDCDTITCANCSDHPPNTYNRKK